MNIYQFHVWMSILLVVVVLGGLAGQPAAQAEEVTLRAAFESPSGARGTLVMTVKVAEAAGEPAAPVSGAVAPPAAPIPEPGTIVLVGLGLLGLVLLKNRIWNTDD